MRRAEKVAVLAALAAAAAAWLVSSAAAAGGQARLERVVAREGVEVFRRHAPPPPGASSALVDLVARAEVDAPPEVVLALLCDYAWRLRYLPELRENRVLGRGPSWSLVYHRVKPPVLSERDYTLLVTWGRKGETLWSRFRTANERGPAPRRGAVRLTLHEGSWRVTPRRGGRASHVVYELRLDFAGIVPGWLLRSRMAKSIPDLFVALRKEAAARRGGTRGSP